MFKKGNVVFSLDGKELCVYDFSHSFPGEMTQTKNLLAYENRVPSERILVEYFPGVKRPEKGFPIGKGTKIIGESGTNLIAGGLKDEKA